MEIFFSPNSRLNLWCLSAVTKYALWSIAFSGSLKEGDRRKQPALSQLIILTCHSNKKKKRRVRCDVPGKGPWHQTQLTLQALGIICTEVPRSCWQLLRQTGLLSPVPFPTISLGVTSLPEVTNKRLPAEWLGECHNRAHAHLGRCTRSPTSRNSTDNVSSWQEGWEPERWSHVCVRLENCNTPY